VDQDVTFGNHLALHLSAGLLFLGGGSLTLGRRPEQLACLVAAVFPRFPAHAHDNQYHLQPLRHLFVLAAEPR
jgi:anaphase-promoting complex subunit 1